MVPSARVTRTLVFRLVYDVVRDAPDLFEVPILVDVDGEEHVKRLRVDVANRLKLPAPIRGRQPSALDLVAHAAGPITSTHFSENPKRVNPKRSQQIRSA